jgi:hypothetical protein
MYDPWARQNAAISATDDAQASASSASWPSADNSLSQRAIQSAANRSKSSRRSIHAHD